MQRVLMTESKHGSPDGFSVKFYEKGKEYDLPEGLAKIFVESDKVAELVKVEGKAEKAAPKNKAEKVEANKAE